MRTLANSLLGFLLLAAIHTTASAHQAASRVGPGDKIAGFELRDFQGRVWKLNTTPEKKADDNTATLIVFVGTECPLVQLYAPKLQALANDFGDKLRVVAIDANQQDSLQEIAQFVKKHELTFPVLKDPGNRVADALGAQRTPESILVDSTMTIRYRGRLDDQYTYGLQRPAAEHDYIREAIDAMLSGNDIEISQTEVVGCHIGRLLETEQDSPITYTNQIARILQNRCVSCHRPGEIGPFSLTDFDEVVGWAEMIAEVVEEQRMPPWHASPDHGKFSNEARLTEEEKKQIFRWVEAGAPEGDLKQLPPPLVATEGWQIGEPDVVIEMSDKPFTVAATGAVPYEYFVVDPGFTEDKWIKAAECRPGNRSVVHHIIVGIAKEDDESKSSELQSEWLTATAPGAKPLVLPDGFAKRIPAGSKLVFQMHYTANGRQQQDLSKVGFVFADPAEVKHQVYTQLAVNTGFEIPSGASNHEVEAWYDFREDSFMLAMFPHMHLRGKSFRYVAHYPNGKQETLLDIPHFDFNWQNAYILESAHFFPAGTRLHCIAHFDNSEDNFANPDPSQPVKWGDQTWEEMMIGYFDMYLARKDGPGIK